MFAYVHYGNLLSSVESCISHWWANGVTVYGYYLSEWAGGKYDGGKEMG